MNITRIRDYSAVRLPAYAFLALASIALLAVPALRAQDQGQPARAIRLSYVDGKVQLAQGGQVVTDQAVINTPLLQGMTLTTADEGKAEIQFEDGSVARIAPNSSLTLTTLAGAGTSAQADMALNSGEAYFELQGNGQVGPMRVHFGDAVVNTSGFTVLRVQYDTPPGALAVFSGNAHIDSNMGLSTDLHGGESIALSASGPARFNVAQNIESDSWDAWNSDRDQALNAEAASQTGASNDLAQGQSSNPAWSDLDSSGSWYNVPGQGYVWSPYEAANTGFDPYGFGNWVWLPGFGYTWASGYSWGYLPYSCGAWNFYDGFGWGWAPGLGGCSPWWTTGIYTGPIFGFTPGWYRPVRRPGPPGERPWRGHPVPMIAISHNQPAPINGALPSRNRNIPVTIGGATVVGLRTFPGRTTPRPGIVVRSGFAATSSGSFNNRPVYTAPPRSIYTSPSQSALSPSPTRPANSPQPPSNGVTVFPQPGRTFTPPINRGNVAPSNPNVNRSGFTPSVPAPPARTYTPPPAPSSRPSGGGNSGGGHSSPAPSSGGGGFHGGGAPSSGAGGGGHSSGGGSGHK